MSIRINKIISFITGKHIADKLSKEEGRNFIATANVQILSFLITCIMEGISFVNYKGELLNFIHIVDLELLLEMSFAWFILRRGYPTISRVITCSSLIVHIGWIGFAIPNSQVHFFWSASALIPLLIFPYKNKKLRIIFTILPFIMLIFHQYYFRIINGMAWFENATLQLIVSESIPGLILSQILLLFLVYRFVKTATEAELKLKGQYIKSEKLLLNILPEKIAIELKENEKTKPVFFKSATVCFTDFVGFTSVAEKLSPEELVNELDFYFSHFDTIMDKYNLEKLKTIGDSFMFAGGVPAPNENHAFNCVNAALDIQKFIDKTKTEKLESGLPFWTLRIGIHSGPIVAGVIGDKKFSYDVWGDTVNTASRCESSGITGEINISAETYLLVKESFDCEYRGEIEVKNKKGFGMYFVRGVK